MKKINLTIPIPDAQHTIYFLDDFAALDTYLKEQIGDRKYLIVTDINVEKTIPKELETIHAVTKIILPAGESTKKWQHTETILNACFRYGLDRNSVLVAVGGGVIGDITGFAASIYMRGIKCIQLPTSLLAMVDASVGGKTGINTTYGKNLVGTITQPETILTCFAWLDFLPAVEIQNGLCEMVKHGILGNKKHFDDLETIAKKSESNVKTVLEEIINLIPQSVEIKADIVQADSREACERMKLNLGHTFGHGIEKLSEYDIPHGQAVAIGTVMAAKYAHTKKICDQETVDQITQIFANFGIDTTCPFDEKDIWNEMTHDKKKSGKNVNLILPVKIGEVKIVPVEL